MVFLVLIVFVIFFTQNGIFVNYCVDDVVKYTSLDVKAQVIERFVQVEYKIKAVLTGKKNKKHTFFVFIPDGAFMSGLVVKEANKVYKGIVVDRDEDKELIAEKYSEHMFETIIRDPPDNMDFFVFTKKLKPNVPVEVTFFYDFNLEWTLEYELYLHLQPGRLVDKINVEINLIKDSPFLFIRLKPVQSGRASSNDDMFHPELLPDHKKETIGNTTKISIEMDSDQQKELTMYLGSEEEKGFNGRIILRYDIDRSLGSDELKSNYSENEGRRQKPTSFHNANFEVE